MSDLYCFPIQRCTKTVSKLLSVQLDFWNNDIYRQEPKAGVKYNSFPTQSTNFKQFCSIRSVHPSESIIIAGFQRELAGGKGEYLFNEC